MEFSFPLHPESVIHAHMSTVLFPSDGCDTPIFFSPHTSNKILSRAPLISMLIGQYQMTERKTKKKEKKNKKPKAAGTLRSSHLYGNSSTELNLERVLWGSLQPEPVLPSLGNNV